MSEKFVQQVLDACEFSNQTALNIGAAEGRYINPLLEKYADVFACEADKWATGKVPAVKEAYDNTTSLDDMKKLENIYQVAITSSGNAPSVKETYERAISSLKQGILVPPFDFTRVRVIDKAIAPQLGMSKLYMSSLNVGRHTINEEHWKRHGSSWGYSSTYKEVESVTIDELCKNLYVGGIICDIEGGEALIFEGGRETLQNNSMDVVVELHESIDFRPMTEIFVNSGYKIYTEKGISNDGMVHALFSNRARWNLELPFFMEKVIL